MILNMFVFNIWSVYCNEMLYQALAYHWIPSSQAQIFWSISSEPKTMTESLAKKKNRSDAAHHRWEFIVFTHNRTINVNFYSDGNTVECNSSHNLIQKIQFLFTTNAKLLVFFYFFTSIQLYSLVKMFFSRIELI